MSTLLTPALLHDRLGALLDAMLSAYERLASAGEAHRDAIRAADTRAMDAAVMRQTILFREVSGLDQKRRELVAHAHTSFPGLKRSTPDKTTLTQLASFAPDTARGALVDRADALRALAKRVHEQSSGIRSAALSLMAHMEGVMRQVARQLSHTGTYSRRGVVEVGSSVLTAVDLRT